MRLCTRCKRQLPIERFSRSKTGREGLHSYCKECMSEYTRAMRPKTVHPSKACVVCGDLFVPKDRRRVFCSANCKAAARYRRLHPKGKRACQACGKDISEMRADAKWCSTACSNRGPKRPEIRRRAHLKSLYGLTLEEYDAILERQDGRCAICRTTEIRGYGKRLAVDHCHDSKRVRGILCGNCNRGLGAFGHDRELLAAASAYLNN